jgi:hypothetical protein
LANPFSRNQTRPPTTSAPSKKAPISLNAAIQSKLYAEVELMISVSANSFIMQQHRDGNLSMELLSKIVAAWQSKGRPQVIEFMYDQITQSELVHASRNTFIFNSDRGTTPTTRQGMFLTWRALARDMSVRTFCCPDAMIRKHLSDVAKVLEFLEAPAVIISTFAKLKDEACTLMREESRKIDEMLLRQQRVMGQEREWAWPKRADSLGRPEGFEGDYYPYGSGV